MCLPMNKKVGLNNCVLKNEKVNKGNRVRKDSS